MSELQRPEDHLPPASEAHGEPDPTLATLRAAEVAKWRAMGMTYDWIAKQMGFADQSGPRLLLKRYADNVLHDNVELMRATWNETHRLQLANAMTIMQNPKTTNIARLRANDTITRISAASRQLNGLNAPIKVEVSDTARAMIEQALSLLEDTVLGEVTAVTDEPYEQPEAADG